MGDILVEIFEAVRKGNAAGVEPLIRAALEQGMGPGAILDSGLIRAMTDVGERWKRDEIFMPEVMIAARAMKAGMNILDPLLSQHGVVPKGKVVLCTVRGDLHDIGKNLVSIMFRGAGFQVVDLGVDVAEERLLRSLSEERPQIVGLSALLTLTLPSMASTVAAVKRSRWPERIAIMVGGAPVTPAFAQEIGADGYAPDAASAVDRARELLAASGGG